MKIILLKLFAEHIVHHPDSLGYVAITHSFKILLAYSNKALFLECSMSAALWLVVILVLTQTDKEATTRNLLGAGKVLVTQSCLCNSWTIVWPSRLLSPWNFPGKNTGVGSHPLLQGIFPTQGSNLGLLHYRQTLSPLGSPSSEQMGELWQVSHQQLNGWLRVLLANA